MQRAWACAGYLWLVDFTVDEPFVLVAEGEAPVLCLPSGLTPAEHDWIFGWAIADLQQQRAGWIALVQHVAGLADIAA